MHAAARRTLFWNANWFGVSRRVAHIAGFVALLVALMSGVALVPGCGDAPARGGPLETSVVIGETGRFPGQFAYPRAIDAHGSSLVIVDKSARVQRIDPGTGVFLGGWAMPESDLGKPTGITVGPHPFDAGVEAVYVADTHYHRVMVYPLPLDALEKTSRRVAETPPEPILTLGGYGTEDGSFVYVTDAAPLPSADPARPVSRIYVSEYGGNDRVSVFERVGDGFEFAFAFGTPGHGDGTPGSREGVMFHRPQSLALDGDRGELLVTDASNHRVGRFTLDGELIGWIGGVDAVGVEPLELRYPYGIAVLRDGTALVSEFGGNCVRRIDIETGTSVGVYGEAGRLEGQLASPWGIAVVDRTVYVLDSGNDRVQGFRSPAPAADLAEAGRNGEGWAGP
ncbi:MAG: hypothetical protein AAF235_03865 [Planctomycetota bacterium]